ncbi:ABC transporter substrate-binding protein [Vulcanisaeta sp. JCM 14467]|uniref:ABC transporter substrate-binding protein n=1 Tax=Vulcanisaeta sp. JCM 14467 TaxID=1295370 RepID=UPI000A75458A|nr:ABC transporter substrate-binding protein [Vulcanisaeta sp. JCM 14467]
MKTVKIGSFTTANIEAIKKLNPDLIILSYPVQGRLVEPLSNIAPVLAIPMPVNLNAIVASFEMVGELLDLDEEARRVAGIYMDLLKHSIDLERALVVLSLGDYVIPCEASYIASALDRVGIRYVKGLKCVELITNRDGVLSIINKTDPQLVIYESKTKEYRTQETGWISKPLIHTPNDVLAHFGPSLPLDIQLLINAIRNGEKFVRDTSSVTRPSLGDPWYRPYS